MSLVDRYLPILKAKLTPSLRDEIGSDIDTLSWVERTGGIEADIGPRVLRVDAKEISLISKRFQQGKRIPL